MTIIGGEAPQPQPQLPNMLRQLGEGQLISPGSYRIPGEPRVPFNDYASEHYDCLPINTSDPEMAQLIMEHSADDLESLASAGDKTEKVYRKSVFPRPAELEDIVRFYTPVDVEYADGTIGKKMSRVWVIGFAKDQRSHRPVPQISAMYADGGQSIDPTQLVALIKKQEEKQ
jgi:hypothetical protein